MQASNKQKTEPKWKKREVKDLTWMLGALTVKPGGLMEIDKNKLKLKDPANRSKVELKGKDKERSAKINKFKREKAFGTLDCRAFPGS